MAVQQHDDNDGSDIFWPGYVDAVTNLVLNLLFLLTIMTVAVFMFALELGRASKGGPAEKSQDPAKQQTQAALKPTLDPVKENIELKREIQRLNMQLAQQVSQKTQPVQPPIPAKTVDITSVAPKQQNKIDKAIVNDFEITVRFKDEAVAIAATDRDQLREALQPIMTGGKAVIHVEVPTGFSEAKRMGFYRALAVRNLLLEMKMPKDAIDVSVREGKNNANASIVKVRSH